MSELLDQALACVNFSCANCSSWPLGAVEHSTADGSDWSQLKT